MTQTAEHLYAHTHTHTHTHHTHTSRYNKHTHTHHTTINTHTRTHTSEHKHTPTHRIGNNMSYGDTNTDTSTFTIFDFFRTTSETRGTSLTSSQYSAASQRSLWTYRWEVLQNKRFTVLGTFPITTWNNTRMFSRPPAVDEHHQHEFPEALPRRQTHQAPEAGLYHPDPSVDVCAILQGQRTTLLFPT